MTSRSDAILLAENEIFGTYGEIVSVSLKKKHLTKFGRLESLGTSLETIWAFGGNETYVFTDLINSVVSDSASDTTTVEVQGHTAEGSGADIKYKFKSQVVTLDGTTPVTLPVPLARCSRISANGDIDLVGNIFVFQGTSGVTAGVPDDSTKVHASIPASQQSNQSFKCATTFSNDDYFLLNKVRLTVLKKQAATVDFRLEVRQPGGVFKPIDVFGLNSVGQNTYEYNFDTFEIIPANSDVRIRAAASTTGVDASASFSGYIARVIKR